MAKALKPLLIVLLLLGIAALTLGILLFNKREILKGRTQKLEQTVTAVATTLNDGKEPFIQPKGVTLDSTSLMDFESMDAELSKLRNLAGVRYEELDNTYADLKKTSDELDATKTELAQTRSELEAANREIVSLKDTIVQKDNEIAQANVKIDSLNQQVAGLESQVTDLNSQLAKIQEEKNELNDKIAQMDQDIKSLEADLANALGKGEGAEERMAKGLSGTILLVNKDWNFVVLDVGMDKGAKVNGVFLVHRDDKLIGKVRVSAVTRDLALAEIVNDWQTAAIKKGDKIVY